MEKKILASIISVVLIFAICVSFNNPFTMQPYVYSNNRIHINNNIEVDADTVSIPVYNNYKCIRLPKITHVVITYMMPKIETVSDAEIEIKKLTSNSSNTKHNRNTITDMNHYFIIYNNNVFITGCISTSVLFDKEIKYLLYTDKIDFLIENTYEYISDMPSPDDISKLPDYCKKRIHNFFKKRQTCHKR